MYFPASNELISFQYNVNKIRTEDRSFPMIVVNQVKYIASIIILSPPAYRIIYSLVTKLMEIGYYDNALVVVIGLRISLSVQCNDDTLLTSPINKRGKINKMRIFIS